jgi:hypothetical protein
VIVRVVTAAGEALRSPSGATHERAWYIEQETHRGDRPEVTGEHT